MTEHPKVVYCQRCKRSHYVMRPQVIAPPGFWDEPDGMPIGFWRGLAYGLTFTTLLVGIVLILWWAQP